MKIALHHIGILVKDISKETKRYVIRYNAKVKSPIIYDPVQTAYVQFCQIENDSSLIEFVSPDGVNSKLSNALKKGGGLHHLCYSTNNIDQFCKDLEFKGMFLLQKPVSAVAFPGRRIAWLMGSDGIPVELVERGKDDWEIK